MRGRGDSAPRWRYDRSGSPRRASVLIADISGLAYSLQNWNIRRQKSPDYSMI